jgi:hypothetical protein
VSCCLTGEAQPGVLGVEPCIHFGNWIAASHIHSTNFQWIPVLFIVGIKATLRLAMEEKEEQQDNTLYIKNLEHTDRRSALRKRGWTL